MGGVTVTNIEDFRGALQELRMDVEAEGRRPQLVMLSGVFRQRDITEVATICYPPWVIGYRVKEMLPVKPGFFLRTVYIKNTEQTINEIPDKEKDPIASAVFDELLDRQQGMPFIDVPEPHTIVFQQEFQPFILERPRMVRL